MVFRSARLALCEFDLERTRSSLYNYADDLLEMNLSDSPAPARARYVKSPEIEAQSLGTVHFFPGGHPVEVDWVAGKRRVVRCFFPVKQRVQGRTWSRTELLAALNVRNATIESTLSRLAMELDAPGFASAALTKSLSGLAAVELGRYFRSLPEAATTSQELSHLQLSQIDDRILTAGKLPTVDEIAELCGISRRHFFRVFHKTTGRSFVDYASELRIKRAKVLLQDENSAIKQVAYQCGFCNPAAFSASFRRIAGVSPRDYRAEHGRGVGPQVERL